MSKILHIVRSGLLSLIAYRYEYLWQDSENPQAIQPTRMPAPHYIEHLIAWVQNSIDDEDLFPTRTGLPFPKTFRASVHQIFKRMFRVYAHIYCHHYAVIRELGLEQHLNTSLKHYVLFIDEHKFATKDKEYWGPMGELVVTMLEHDPPVVRS